MSVPYPTTDVANYFIAKSRQHGRELSWQKLIKLVYLAYCWHLHYYRVPLTVERPVAWIYGPVFLSLKKHNKSLGALVTVRRLSRTFREWWNRKPLSESAERLLATIWSNYGDFSGPQLSTATAHDEAFLEIKDALIAAGDVYTTEPLYDDRIIHHYGQLVDRLTSSREILPHDPKVVYLADYRT